MQRTWWWVRRKKRSLVRIRFKRLQRIYIYDKGLYRVRERDKKKKKKKRRRRKKRKKRVLKRMMNQMDCRRKRLRMNKLCLKLRSLKLHLLLK